MRRVEIGPRLFTLSSALCPRHIVSPRIVLTVAGDKGSETTEALRTQRNVFYVFLCAPRSAIGENSAI